MGGNDNFENRHQIFYFFTYRPEILHTLESDNTQNCVGAIFEFPPPKNLAPL